MTGPALYSVTFISVEGERFTVPIKRGTSIMEAAVARDTPGIEAQCYGAGVCGTCHVYAEPETAGLLPEKTEWEAEMLSGLELARPESRLACQIRFEPQYDGMAFHLPERQEAMS